MEILQPESRQPETTSWQPRSGYVGGSLSWFVILFLILLLALYLPIIGEAIPVWLNDVSASHGLFVPLMVALLLYWKRAEFAAAPPRPSVWGLAPLTVGLLIQAVAWYAHIQFFAMLSIVPVLVGLALLTSGLRRTRIILYPLLFLAFMAPLPVWLIMPVSFPIQNISAHAANWSVQQIGITTVQEGFHISLVNGTTVEVAEACSGFNKTLTVLVVTSFYAALFTLPLWRQVGLVMAAIPMAILANIARVSFLIAIGAWFGEKGVHMVHDYADPLVVIVCFLLVYQVGRVVGCKKIRYLT